MGKVELPVDSTKAAHRDIAWKVWDGIDEMIASATGQDVFIWKVVDNCWQVAHRVGIRDEVWKITWMEMGNVLLVSCGEKEQRALLMKQQVGGEWDVLDTAQVDS